MIDRLFMRGADGFAPGICAVGVDVFVLGEVQGLHEGLAEVPGQKADPSLPSGFAKSSLPRKAGATGHRVSSRPSRWPV